MNGLSLKDIPALLAANARLEAENADLKTVNAGLKTANARLEAYIEQLRETMRKNLAAIQKINTLHF